MGFKPPRKIYNLDFAGTEYDGAHVRMRGVTVGEEMHINELRANNDRGAVQELFKAVVGLLVDWDIEDDNGPVPTTFEGVSSQDSTFIGAVLNAFFAAASGVPAPLPEGSHSGEPSLVASIPTETLSESLAS
jgi:hypothetical protein